MPKNRRRATGRPDGYFITGERLHRPPLDPEAPALKLGAARAHVILDARDAQRLGEVRRLVERVGGRASVRPADITNAESTENLCRGVMQFVEGLDGNRFVIISRFTTHWPTVGHRSVSPFRLDPLRHCSDEGDPYTTRRHDERHRCSASSAAPYAVFCCGVACAFRIWTSVPWCR